MSWTDLLMGFVGGMAFVALVIVPVWYARTHPPKE